MLTLRLERALGCGYASDERLSGSGQWQRDVHENEVLVFSIWRQVQRLHQQRRPGQVLIQRKQQEGGLHNHGDLLHIPNTKRA